MTDTKFIYNIKSGVLHHPDCDRISLMNKENILRIYEAEIFPENSRMCVHCSSKIKEQISKMRNEIW